MTATYLHVGTPEGSHLVEFERERCTVGKSTTNDLALVWDESVSHLHAVFQRYPTGWTIHDLDSRNGTFVNGERIWGEHPLRNGDEIRLGQTVIGFREMDTKEPLSETRTEAISPDLTRREFEVLLALCGPVLAGDIFTEPASTEAIASELFITEAAVRQHLSNLYDKFQLYDSEGRRRGRLANEAIHRGAVSFADIKSRGLRRET